MSKLAQDYILKAEKNIKKKEKACSVGTEFYLFIEFVFTLKNFIAT